MEVKNIKEVKGFKNMHSIKKAGKILDKDYAQIIEMILEPGDYVKEHKTPVDVSFFIVKGSVDMKIGNEEKKVNCGDMIVSPKNITHSFKNNYSEVSEVLVIKHVKSN